MLCQPSIIELTIWMLSVIFLTYSMFNNFGRYKIAFHLRNNEEIICIELFFHIKGAMDTFFYKPLDERLNMFTTL